MLNDVRALGLESIQYTCACATVVKCVA